MASITVRNMPDEVHRALRARAAAHGRSTEAEVRDILRNAVNPPERIRMGEALRAIGKKFALKDDDLTFDRDRKPAEPLSFE